MHLLVYRYIKISDLLDFFVTKGISLNKVNVDSSYNLSSYHLAVILTVSFTIFEKGKQALLYNAKTDWTKFRQLIDGKMSLNNSPITEDDIEEAAEILITNMQHAAWESTPEIEKNAENISKSLSI